MGKVSFGFSMSLDGFVAGLNDGPEHPLGEGGEALFAWYFSGDLDDAVPNGDGVIKMNRHGAERVREGGRDAGVLVTGRRTFDIAGAWGGRHPLEVPIVVVTHRPAKEWMKAGSPFTFVTDGIESALAQARRIAGDKNVVIGGPSIAQQALRAGLVDEFQIDLAPVLLGGGVRLFDHLGAQPIALESTRVEAAPGVTHLTFRVVR